MSLFNKTNKKTEGNIPETMGINQKRADEIIKAIIDCFSENRGDINKVFTEIEADITDKNELMFACYSAGCIKVHFDQKLENMMPKGLRNLMQELDEMLGDK